MSSLPPLPPERKKYSTPKEDSGSDFEELKPSNVTLPPPPGERKRFVDSSPLPPPSFEEEEEAPEYSAQKDSDSLRDEKEKVLKVEDDLVNIENSDDFEPLLPASEPEAVVITRPVDSSGSPVFPPHIQASAQALLDYIGDDECSEVLMNGPNECSRKIRGSRYHSPEITFETAQHYHDVINEVILGYCDTKDRIDGKTVLIEGQMELPSPSGKTPMVARVHIIAPPGVQYAKVTIAKKPRTDLTLDDMVQVGTMTREMAEFLKAVARGRATFVVAGPTGAGKSTLLQAMSHYFDPNDRIVVIEETPELRLPLGDVVYLKATLERPGMSLNDIYTLEFWAKQANRMRMDRVIVGETRGSEMAEWLVAANSGAEGSATTVHAESPRRTLDKMLGLASRASGSMSEDQLRREVAATVDIIVQCALIDGRHIVTGIEEVANTITQQTSQILSNPLFAYDRARGVHIVKGRPSDEFIAQLGNRGVPLNAAWFRGPQSK